MKGVPPWMQAVLEGAADDETVIQAIRAREVMMPPELRMSGPKRQLRDAHLARMMLAHTSAQVEDAYWTLIRLADRENRLTRLRAEIRRLKTIVGPDGAQKCQEAATTLFGWEVLERRSRGSKGRK